MRLTEGLRRGDLRALVQPIVSIDEYESKLGEDSDVIVVAFFVGDEEPADDLNGFIEHGYNEILDSEKSPAPNEDGYYLVFVEYVRDEKFPQEIVGLAKEVGGLAEVEEWKFKPFRHREPVPLTEENVEKFVTLDRKEILRKQKTQKEIEKEIKEYLTLSDLNDVLIEGEYIELSSYFRKAVFEVIDFAVAPVVVRRNGLLNEAVRLQEQRATGYERLLGPRWAAEPVGDYVLLSNAHDDRALLLRPL